MSKKILYDGFGEPTIEIEDGILTAIKDCRVRVSNLGCHICNTTGNKGGQHMSKIIFRKYRKLTEEEQDAMLCHNNNDAMLCQKNKFVMEDSL